MCFTNDVKKNTPGITTNQQSITRHTADKQLLLKKRITLSSYIIKKMGKLAVSASSNHFKSHNNKIFPTIILSHFSMPQMKTLPFQGLSLAQVEYFF